MILTYDKRQELWEWCRNFIDTEAIYRVDETHPMLPGKNPKGRYTFQFYLRRATFNPQFAISVGMLFWDHFYDIHKAQPFQICTPEPSGPPIGAAIQAAANVLGIKVNVFSARREPKSFGLDNWFNGKVLPGVPVLMVEDIAASAPFMLRASVRVQQKLGLPLHRNYFTLVNKVGAHFKKDHQYTENYLDGQLIALFTFNNFARNAENFTLKHGRKQNWAGLVA
jgi:orotate phosphoribosyltransferase